MKRSETMGEQEPEWPGKRPVRYEHDSFPLNFKVPRGALCALGVMGLERSEQGRAEENSAAPAEDCASSGRRWSMGKWGAYSPSRKRAERKNRCRKQRR